MNKNKKGPNISGHFMKINTETCIILGGGTSMVSPIEHINRISPYACIVFYSIMFNCDKNNVCKLDINGLCLYIAKIKKKFHIDESLFCLLNMKRYIDILVNNKYIYVNEKGEIILSTKVGTKTNANNLKDINEKLPEELRYIGTQDTLDEDIIPRYPNNPVCVHSVNIKNAKYKRIDPNFHGTRQLIEYRKDNKRENPIIGVEVKLYTYRNFIQLNLKKEEVEELIAMAIKKEIDLRYFLLFATTIFKYDNSININRYTLSKMFNCSKRTIDEKIKQLVNCQVFKKEQMESESKKNLLKRKNKKRIKRNIRPLKKLCNKVALFFNSRIALKTNNKNKINFWGKSLTDKSPILTKEQEKLYSETINNMKNLLGEEEYRKLMGIKPPKEMIPLHKELHPREETFNPESFWYGVLF